LSRDERDDEAAMATARRLLYVLKDVLAMLADTLSGSGRVTALGFCIQSGGGCGRSEP
jgi:hypothetical protein